MILVALGVFWHPEISHGPTKQFVSVTGACISRECDDHILVGQRSSNAKSPQASQRRRVGTRQSMEAAEGWKQVEKEDDESEEEMRRVGGGGRRRIYY